MIPTVNGRLAATVYGLVILFLPVVNGSAGYKPATPGPLIPPQESKLNDRAFIAEGAKLFLPNCSSAYCHGSNGKGGGAPPLRDKGLDAAYLFKTISNGIPRSPMRAFKSELSEEKIWQLVAYIMSPLASDDPTASAKSVPDNSDAGKPPGVPATPPESSANATLSGDPGIGKSLFFDTSQPKSCQSCHSFQGMGSAVGPDLSKLGVRPARELFLAIVMPGDARDQRYRTLTITLKDGEKIVGIKKEEDSDSVRIYDLTELPAVLRTVQKSEIAASGTSNASAMPADYSRIYTLKQLLDIVAFLKSADKGTKRVVQLTDVLDSRNPIPR